MRIIGLIAGAAALVAALGAAQAREVVNFRDTSVSAGTIVVRTSERRLYYVVGDGRAIRYPVGVGMASKQWTGTTRIDGKHLRPAWSPPKEVKRDKPSLPDLIPGGSPKNPMGEAALTLAGGEYAIHGTNVPTLDRRLRLLRLHPHVQPGRGRSLQPRQRRHDRRRHALTASRASAFPPCCSAAIFFVRVTSSRAAALWFSSLSVSESSAAAPFSA